MMNEIVISEIQIIPVKPKNGLIGFASCVVNNQLYLGSIAIYTRPDGSGYRLVYPVFMHDVEAIAEAKRKREEDDTKKS